MDTQTQDYTGMELCEILWNPYQTHHSSYISSLSHSQNNSDSCELQSNLENPTPLWIPKTVVYHSQQNTFKFNKIHHASNHVICRPDREFLHHNVI